MVLELGWDALGLTLELEIEFSFFGVRAGDGVELVHYYTPIGVKGTNLTRLLVNPGIATSPASSNASSRWNAIS